MIGTMDTYKSLNINIGTVMKIPDLGSVPNRYKTQEMCNKAVENYSYAL